MKVEEIYSMLSATGIETAYYQFPVGEAPDLPYIVFYFPNDNSFVADSKVFQKIAHLNVELYTNEKDFDIEAQLEQVLDQNGFVYTRAESYLDSEKMYEVLYEMEVLING